MYMCYFYCFIKSSVELTRRLNLEGAVLTQDKSASEILPLFYALVGKPFVLAFIKRKKAWLTTFHKLTLTISAVRVSTTKRDHLVVLYTKNKYQFSRIDFLQFLLSLESWEGFNIFVSQFWPTRYTVTRSWLIKLIKYTVNQWLYVQKLRA